MAGKKGIIPHHYSEAEIEFLRVNYPSYSCKVLTKLFNAHFNLTLSAATIKSSLTRFNIKSGRTGRFEKGQTSFNKGKKWDEFMSPEAQANSRRTCFSKDRSINNANHNEVPVGTEQVNAEGYIEVKVDYDTKNKARRFWKYKHHMVWEAVNGPIPEGMNIIFADGNKLNCDIDNLIMVSNSELAYLNNSHLIFKDCGEATKVGVTIVKLNERMRKRGKK
jgi:hypothetical protein